MGSFNIDSIEDFLTYKGLNNFNNVRKEVWEAICWSVLYLALSARNKRVFENKISNLSNICDELQVLSFLWVSNRAKGSVSYWVEWCSDPSIACKSVRGMI